MAVLRPNAELRRRRSRLVPKWGVRVVRVRIHVSVGLPHDVQRSDVAHHDHKEQHQKQNAQTDDVPGIEAAGTQVAALRFVIIPIGIGEKVAAAAYQQPCDPIDYYHPERRTRRNDWFQDRELLQS